MASRAKRTEPGDRLGDFRIVRRLGEGGMGTVYLAQDERLERRVALKVVAPQLADDPGFRERFEREATQAAAIQHPNVLPVHEAREQDGVLFLAMRYVDGRDLHQLLAEEGRLAPERAARIVADVAAALDAAHAKGLRPPRRQAGQHPDRGRLRARLPDRLRDRQGARRLEPPGSRVIGTLDYMAPEQCDGKLDARSDIYALGCVLHEMLTGSVPFPGTDMQKMWGHVNEPLRRSTTAARIRSSEVVERATAKDPDDRFQSAGDLARAAAAATGGNAGRRSRAQRRHRRRCNRPGRGRRRGGPHPHDEGAGAGRTGASRQTAAMTTAAPRQARSAASRRLGPRRVAAAIGGSVVLAAGLIGGALVLSGGKENRLTTIVSQSAKPRRGVCVEEWNRAATDETSPANRRSRKPARMRPSPTRSRSTRSRFRRPGTRKRATSRAAATWRASGVTLPTRTPRSSSTPKPPPPRFPRFRAPNRSGPKQASSGYRELALKPISLAGLPAARWVFEVSRGPPGRLLRQPLQRRHRGARLDHAGELRLDGIDLSRGRLLHRRSVRVGGLLLRLVAAAAIVAASVLAAMALLGVDLSRPERRDAAVSAPQPPPTTDDSGYPVSANHADDTYRQQIPARDPASE